MKSLFFLPFLLVLASSAKLGVDLSGVVTRTAGNFFCFTFRNVTAVALDIYDTFGHVRSTKFLASFTAAKDAKMKVIDAIVRINDSEDPEDIMADVAAALPRAFDGTIWLYVGAQKGHWNLPQDKRIAYLESYIRACQKRGLKPGVYSSLPEWANVMGSPGAGSNFLKTVPVWYYYLNGDKPNFADFEFAGFGTWDTPKMKTFREPYGNSFCKFNGITLTVSI